MKLCHMKNGIAPADVFEKCQAAYNDGGRDKHDAKRKEINNLKRRLQLSDEYDYVQVILDMARSQGTMSHTEALQIMKENKLLAASIESMSSIEDADRFYKSIRHLEAYTTKT